LRQSTNVVSKKNKGAPQGGSQSKPDRGVVKKKQQSGRTIKGRRNGTGKKHTGGGGKTKSERGGFFSVETGKDVRKISNGKKHEPKGQN